MNYLVICTFDLKSATRDDYEDAYTDLNQIGLKRVQIASNGNKIIIPTTTVMGKFTGSSASQVVTDLKTKVKRIFSNLGLNSEIFIVSAGDWSWVGSKT